MSIVCRRELSFYQAEKSKNTTGYTKQHVQSKGARKDILFFWKSEMFPIYGRMTAGDEAGQVRP